MTPEQRQQVLQAAERQREIFQCQIVSSEVQKRMQHVQVRPPSAPVIRFPSYFDTWRYSLLQAKPVVPSLPLCLLQPRPLQAPCLSTPPPRRRLQWRTRTVTPFQEPAVKFHP